MDPTTKSVLDKKIKGWNWVRAEFDRILAARRAEAERLLGPDRGE